MLLAYKAINKLLLCVEIWQMCTEKIADMSGWAVPVCVICQKRC